jgi:HK97 family phage major capsid protein
MSLKLGDLRAERGALIDSMTAMTESRDFDQAKFGELEVNLGKIDGQLAAAERSQALQASLAKPAGATAERDIGDNGGPPMITSVLPADRRSWNADHYVRHAREATGFVVQPDKHFRSFGDQLQAVARYYMPEHRAFDPRLVRAPTGATSGDPSTGGFLIQTDFSSAVFTRAYDMGQILGRCQKLNISTEANGIKIPGIDETSRASGSRWGGVATSWVGEGTSVTASKPKFRLIELDLKKMMSVMYVTDEILRDTSILTTLAMQAFSEEIMFATEDAIVEGTGAGQPLGILNAGATVSVAKETGQAASTIQYENVLKMWSRMWSRSQQNAVWYINQDTMPQMYALSQVIGTGGVPVYLPANGISGNPYATLFGRPVVPVEYCSTLGTVGDIILADFSQYVLADKGGVESASSAHVAFLTDEMVFRITYRVDGQPMWHSALTPFKGSNTLSPFITLATRA